MCVRSDVGRAYFYSAHRPDADADAESVPAWLRRARRWEGVTTAGDVLWVPTWTWHRVDYLRGVTALSASLFHVRAAPLLTAAPLFTALVVPNMVKELLGWNMQ